MGNKKKKSASTATNTTGIPADKGNAAATAPNPVPTTWTSKQCMEAANGGDEYAKAQMSHLLDDNPQFVAENGDIAGATQGAWIKMLAGSDFVIMSSMMRRLEAMKRELAGPNPTPLERLLVERAAAAWLQAEYADFSVAMPEPNEGLRVSMFKLKRQDAAQRRFLRAAQTLAMVKRITAGTITVVHTNASTTATPTTPPAATSMQADQPVNEKPLTHNNTSGDGGKLGHMLGICGSMPLEKMAAA